MLDLVTVYILIMDYVFRWMTHDLKTGKGWKAFLLYPFTPMAIVDMLSILPTLNVVPQTFRFLRVLRVVKIFRYSRNLVVVTNACMREAKTLFSVFLAVLVYMFTVALVIYTGEPEAFINYFDAVCWAATQMTSVTFSDARPVGYLGKGLSIASALVALLVVALPAGVITGAYINEVRETRRSGSAYFEMNNPVKVRLKDLDRPSVWLKKNLKIFRYLAVIILCSVVTLGIMVAGEYLNVFGTVGIVGVAFAAFTLEPAAGIIVGLISCAGGAIVFQQPDFVLYMSEYTLIALTFGLVLPHRSDEKNRKTRMAVALVLLVLGLAFLDNAVAITRAGYSLAGAVAIQEEEVHLVAVALSWGLDPVPAMLAGTVATYAVSTFISIVIANVLYYGFGLKAAPSEAERRQQQQVILERALRQKELESREARILAKDTLQAELRRLTEQQRTTENSIKLVRDRLAELRDEQGEDDVGSSSDAVQ